MGLFSELDYRTEAENSAAFAEAHCRALPFVTVPRPVEGMVTRKVLVMEWCAAGLLRFWRDGVVGIGRSCSPSLGRATPPSPSACACVFMSLKGELLACSPCFCRVNGARVADLLAQVAKGDSPETAAAIAGAKRLVDMGAQCSLAQLLQTARAHAHTRRRVACHLSTESIASRK